MKLKWSWAGHLASRGDGRWSKAVIEWRLRTEKHSLKMLIWANDIVAVLYILDDTGAGT